MLEHDHKCVGDLAAYQNVPDIDASGRFEFPFTGISRLVFLGTADLAFCSLLSAFGGFICTLRSFVACFLVAGHGE